MNKIRLLIWIIRMRKFRVHPKGQKIENSNKNLENIEI
jgi:hypothetical protein